MRVNSTNTLRSCALRRAASGIAILSIAVTGIVGTAAAAFADDTDTPTVAETPAPRRVWLTLGTGGTVVGGDEFIPGEEVRLVAIPQEGHTFFGWIINGVPDLSVSNEATLVFTMPDGPVTAFASFARVAPEEEADPAPLTNDAPAAAQPTPTASATTAPAATQTPTAAPTATATPTPQPSESPRPTPTTSDDSDAAEVGAQLRSQVSRTI